jgi:hypothetical protein
LYEINEGINKMNKIKILNVGIAALIMLFAGMQPGLAGSNGASVTGMVKVQSPDLCAPNLIGIGVDTNSLNFGALVAGNSASKSLAINVSVSGYEANCGDVPPITVPVMIGLNDWVGSVTPNKMDKDVTKITGLPGIMDETGFSPFPIGTTTPTFTVNIPVGAVPDTYAQIITISAVY